MPKATLTFAMRLFRVALPVALLCLIALTRVALTWRVYTPTFDEPAHIAAGMEWLDRGVYRYEEMHPPLARVADALGPWVAGLHSEGQTGIWREGNAILNQRGDQSRALALARAGALPFLLLAILVVFAWARSLGEFGPILVFAGATRMRTEVLSTTVFLELSVGQLEAAVAVSLLMVVAAMAVLGIVRLVGWEVAR